MKRRWLVPAGLAGALAMIAGAAYASGGSSGTLALNAGASMDVSCPNSLSNSNVAAGSETVNCADNPTTTTTQPPPPPPTTTPPTTQPPPPPTTTPPPPTTVPPPPPPALTSCPQFLEASNNPPAFCDALGTPNPTAGTRSGQLDGVLWGVSRATQNVNPGQGLLYNWAQSSQHPCGTPDVSICNGELVDSVNDGGHSALLAMYPRQPFDFAGRTGTIEFNVSDDSEGGHAAWPTFVITDQPVPAPGDGSWYGDQPGISDLARNSIAVALDAGGAPPVACQTANIFAVANYQPMTIGTNHDGCATTPANTPTGQPTQLNHVEIQVNSAGVNVYMSDVNNPASTRLVADATFHVPLTRGVVWLTDAHYAGCKFNDQCDHSFGWSDLAFDGPVLPRDLGFDVPDAGSSNLGYNGDTVQTANPVTAANIAAAQGALLVFNYWQTPTLTVSVDGTPITVNTPGTGGWASQTIAIPVPLADITPGVQTIVTPGNTPTANYDLILVGAGG